MKRTGLLLFILLVTNPCFPQDFFREDFDTSSRYVILTNPTVKNIQEIVKDTLLMGINFHSIQFTKHPFFGTTINLNKKQHSGVYSSHHQAVEKKGKNLKITALSMDGKIIEGLVHSEYPHVFGVQFHPEVPALYEDRCERRFHPDDIPETYNNLIGKQSVRFHKRFWKHISRILQKAE